MAGSFTMPSPTAISPPGRLAPKDVLGFTLVIPTLGRPGPLRATLAAIAAQTRLPEEVIVVDASGNHEARDILQDFRDRFRVLYQRATEPSAAMQRNQGALRVGTRIIGFLDDDIILDRNACERICVVFEQDRAGSVGGVGARIDEPPRPEPKGLIWLYYRIQAGYAHPTYGGKLFGPAINCYPSYTESEGDLIDADWLNSGCVFYRTPLFHREMFPNFQGYSFMEDVHLSARIARTHRLYFHSKAKFKHQDVESHSKRNVRNIARMRLRNQRLVSREVLGLGGTSLVAKLFLHRVFASVAIIRRRDPDWVEELAGTWT
jgi:glycosyltransferase involved in cell wall biosynthesis